jgi:hypothetical protein
MQQEDENIRNLEEQLPTLQQRFELAQAHADQVEASNLLQDAASDVLNMEQPATDKDLQNAKRAERERRQEVETAERDLRISRLLRDKLEKGLHTLACLRESRSGSGRRETRTQTLEGPHAGERRTAELLKARANHSGA